MSRKSFFLSLSPPQAAIYHLEDRAKIAHGQMKRTEQRPGKSLSRPHDRNGKRASLAKVAAPRLPAVFPRERLFSRLDHLSRHSSMLWVQGSPGAGKTTLVAGWLLQRKIHSLWYQVDIGDREPASLFHYLGVGLSVAAPRYQRSMPKFTPEHTQAMSLFTRQFFRELSRRMKPPFAIVLDNVQEVGIDGPFYEILREGCAELPADGYVIILSRSMPPPFFAKASLDRRMAVIDDDMLRLNEPESIRLVRFLAPDIAKSAAVELGCALHGRCSGWFAGMLLLTEARESASESSHSLKATGQRRLFDYFAGEVFSRQQSQFRDFLMLTALFTDFTADMAARLTGYSEAAKSLRDLVRHHHFTEELSGESSGYRFHPLFRDFLLERGRAFWTPAQLTQSCRRAAQILEEENQSERALVLYGECQDTDATVRLILTLAPQLMATGRLATLQSMIGRLPLAVLSAEPWLLYWSGLSRFPFGMAGMQSLELAYRGFTERNDSAGLYLTWATIVENIYFAFDDFRLLQPWLGAFEKLQQQNLQLPSRDVEVRTVPAIILALSCQYLEHPALPGWLLRAEALLQSDLELNQRLMLTFSVRVHYLWMGEMQKLKNNVQLMSSSSGAVQVGVSPTTQVMSCTIESLYEWQIGNPHTALRLARSALEVVDSLGLVAWRLQTVGQCIYGSLVCGRAADAERFLAELRSGLPGFRGTALMLYRQLSAMTAVHRGDLATAAVDADHSLELGEKYGIVFMRTASHFLAAGIAVLQSDLGKTQRHLDALRSMAERTQAKLFFLWRWLIEAAVATERADQSAARDALKRMLLLSNELCGASVPYVSHALLAKLYVIALENDIEAEHVRNLIRRFEIVPQPLAMISDAWPFPVRIHVLGRLSVLLNDRVLRFTAKTPRKPLDLLKVLIALGGRSVDVNEIMSVLWKGQGRSARAAFDVALMRLRKLLGHPAALVLTEGKLTLDERICWVDVWSFERAVGLFDNNTPKDVDRSVFNLYRGRFLEHEGDARWIVNARDRLAARFRRLVLRVARSEERAENWQAASDLYRRALEHDNLTEEFHFRLMHCELHLGRRAEAIGVYRRCRNLLSINLQAKPSAEFEAAYRRVLASEARP
jgi:LuxR family maltose regulon positive regulatory protein